MQLDVIQLKKKIDRLEELFHSIIGGLAQNSIDNKIVREYKQLKKEILLSLFESPVHKTESKYFPDIRKILQRLTLNGDPFLPDKDKVKPEFEEITNALYEDLDIELTPEEYEELGQIHFYSWFSGEEYAEALIKSQLLILRSERLPKELSHFVEEIRSCYAFQRYTAAFSLCRTLLEIAVRDIYESNKLHQHNSKYAKPTIQYFNEKKRDGKYLSIEKFDPDLFDRIEILSKLQKFETLKGRLHDVRISGNSIVHANRKGTRKSASEMIQNTFNVIHNLYESN